MKFGTLSVLEDLAQDNDPVRGREAQIAARFQEALDIHNDLFADMVGDLADTTDQAQLAFPAADMGLLQDVDEWGQADASKAATSGDVGFPLGRVSGTLQWTNTYIDLATPNLMATQLDAMAAADVAALRRKLAVTFFKPTNTVNYIDRIGTKRTYDLKALINADGQPIPVSPNGKTFDGSTHTHYLGSASGNLDVAYLTSLIDTVVEHGVDGEVRVYIARADEGTVRGLTGFSPYLDQRVMVIGAAQIGSEVLDVNNPDNRAIGVFGGAEIWVKPWVPQNYQAALIANSAIKPLKVRTRTGAFEGTGQFRVVDEHTHFPLHAQFDGREYGVGVYGRYKAAVGRSNNSTYAAPTIP